MIRITSKKEGFRRCGVAHTAAAAEYPDGRFTKAQLAVLKAEPMLIVQVIDDPKPAPEKTGEKASAATDPASGPADAASSVIPAKAGIQEGEKSKEKGKK